MAKSLFSAIVAMALAAFGPTAAQAAAVVVGSTYNFDFSSTPYSETLNQNTVGNSITFASTTNPLLKVKATAWSIEKFEQGTANTADDIVTAATLKIWSGGLGIQNKYEDGTQPNHAMDNGVDPVSGVNHYMVDFVLLQFDYVVDVNTMTTGWVDTDQDATLRVGAGPTSNPANWNTTPALDGKKVFGATGGVELSDYVNMADTSLNSYINDATAGTPQTRNVNTGLPNKYGMTWLLGALYGTDSHDFFKLDMLNVTVFPTIPEPSTWMTMILGFGFVGGTMRRRNASLGKGSAALA